MGRGIVVVCVFAALLAGGCRTPGTAGCAEGMETWVYNCACAQLKFRCSISAERRCFCDGEHMSAAEKAAERKAQWKRFLSPGSGCNVSWPAGSDVKEKGDSLVVTNTRGNLEALAAFLDALRQPGMVELEMRIEGEGKVLAEPRILTRDGHQAIFKSVVEWLYPQDFDVVTATNSCTAVEPQNFTMRETGVVVDVTPELCVDGTVSLALGVSYTGEPQWKDYGESLIAPNGEKYSLPMEQPIFPKRDVDTHLSLSPGTPVTFGDKSLGVTVLARMIALKGTEAPHRQ